MASKTDVMWRIECRKDRKSPWKKRAGLFETRQSAREERDLQRDWYGFGNVRVVKYVRGGGR